jgi:hypothetical protein
MSTRDPLAPPKEYLQELARDDHPKGGGRRDSRVGTAPPPRPPASSGTTAATAILPKSVAALVNTPVTMHLRTVHSCLGSCCRSGSMSSFSRPQTVASSSS